MVARMFRFSALHGHGRLRSRVSAERIRNETSSRSTRTICSRCCWSSWPSTTSIAWPWGSCSRTSRSIWQLSDTQLGLLERHRLCAVLFGHGNSDCALGRSRQSRDHHCAHDGAVERAVALCGAAGKLRAAAADSRRCGGGRGGLHSAGAFPDRRLLHTRRARRVQSPSTCSGYR